mgnify:CR=1 FL=1|tara:strand:+ start:432246 stop:432845 length:600 start_codon:yes stop_codon:yes gene_type:complete
MEKPQFIAMLKSDSLKREDQELLLHSVLQNQDRIEILFNCIRKVDDKKSVQAARILELLCKKHDLALITPYLENFHLSVAQIKMDAVIRSFAKIIELLTIEYFINKNTTFIQKLKTPYLEGFTESCFDWMISDKAIAIKAHSMYALYLLGMKFDWIHPELIQVIDKQLPMGSTGFKNRGKKILKAIQTKRLLKLQTQAT